MCCEITHLVSIKQNQQANKEHSLFTQSHYLCRAPVKTSIHVRDEHQACHTVVHGESPKRLAPPGNTKVRKHPQIRHAIQCMHAVSEDLRLFTDYMPDFVPNKDGDQRSTSHGSSSCFVAIHGRSVQGATGRQPHRYLVSAAITRLWNSCHRCAAATGAGACVLGRVHT